MRPDEDACPASMIMDNRRLCTGLDMPEGPVALPDGKLALVEMGHARKSLTIVSPDGSRNLLCRHGGDPNGLAIDGDGCFWMAGGPGGSVTRIAPTGELLMNISPDHGRDRKGLEAYYCLIHGVFAFMRVGHRRGFSIDGGIAAIAYKDDGPLRQPAPDLPQGLPRPIQHGLMRAYLSGGVTFRGCQQTQERQSPDTLRK